MTVPDEEVFAFVDGELPPEAMARIEAAMATDPQLALRVETQRALRRLLSGAHAGVVHQRPPESLASAVAGQSKAAPKPPPKPAEVIAFPGAQTKKAKVKPRETKPTKPARADDPQSGFPSWIAMAACLVAGLVVGRMAMPSPATLSGADEPAPIAAGPLAQALNTQTSGQRAGPVRIGLSFKDKAGLYCRTFQASGQAPIAGVACREPSAWRVRAVSPTAPTSSADYRTAGSETPPAILANVDAMIVGQPLDAAGEAKARAANWKPTR